MQRERKKRGLACEIYHRNLRVQSVPVAKIEEVGLIKKRRRGREITRSGEIDRLNRRIDFPRAKGP